MTATRTLYRQASVSRAEATASLFKRFPKADLVSFVEKTATADEAAAARAKEGDRVYAATIRVAEFPPSDEGDDADAGEDAGAPVPPKEDSDDKSDSKDDGDDSSDKGDDFGEKGDDEGGKPKKLSPEEQIVHLLTQILDKIDGGSDLLGDDPDGPGGPDGLGGPPGDLPDIGAPDKGDVMGGPPGPPGGGPGKAPLPPPVKAKSPIGVGAFASVAQHAEVSMVRADAGEVNNAGILKEAAQYAPTHRVAKIQRTGLAKIGDDLIDLAEAKFALVTLVSQ